MNGGLALLGVGILAGLTMQAVASFILNFFVALRSRPNQRAAWVAGIAYLPVAAFITFGGPPGYALWGPVVTLPGAAVVFWFWRREYTRAWIDDPAMLAEGEELEHDDWMIGLFKLGALLSVAIGLALYRHFTR